MAFTINTNDNSLYSQGYLDQHTSAYSNALQRIAAGISIINASDNPAGLAIASTMQANINGYNQGAANAATAVNLVQTAQGSMQAIQNDLQQMNSLAVQAASGTNNSADLADINTQYQSLLSDVNRIANSSSFNGVNLLNGSTGNIAVQVGASNSANDQVGVSLINATTGTNGLNIDSTAVDTQANAQAAISSLNAAINSVSTGMASIGASEASLQSAIQSNTTYATEQAAAESTIRDTNYAAASSSFTQNQILTQADNAMLVQANMSNELALQLLSSDNNGG